MQAKCKRALSGQARFLLIICFVCLLLFTSLGSALSDSPPLMIVIIGLIGLVVAMFWRPVFTLWLVLVSIGLPPIHGPFGDTPPILPVLLLALLVRCVQQPGKGTFLFNLGLALLICITFLLITQLGKIEAMHIPLFLCLFILFLALTTFFTTRLLARYLRNATNLLLWALIGSLPALILFPEQKMSIPLLLISLACWLAEKRFWGRCLSIIIAMFLLTNILIAENMTTFLVASFLWLLVFIFAGRQELQRNKQQTIRFVAVLTILGNILLCLAEPTLIHIQNCISICALGGIALRGWEPFVHGFARQWHLRHQRIVSLSPVLVTSQQYQPSSPKTVRAILMPLLSWLITIPITIPVTALLTHYLGPTNYGLYSFTVPLLALGALISGTGMDPAIIRQLSRQPREKWSDILSYAAGARFISTSLGVVVVILLALLLPLTNDERLLLMIGSCSLYFSFFYNGFRSIYSHGFRAQQQIKSLVILEMCNRLSAAIMVGIICYFRLPVILSFLLLSYNDLPFFLIQYFIASRQFKIRLRFSRQSLREHLLGSFAVTGYDGLMLVIAQADTFFLMLIANPLSVGLYSLAISISDPLLTIAYAYINGIYPLFCATYEKSQRAFSHSFYEALRILLLIVIPLSLWVSFHAALIVDFLGGENFAASGLVVGLIMWTTAFIFINQLAMRCCMAIDRERSVLKVALVAACINIGGNLIFIPLFSTIGAASVALISEIVTVFWLFFLIRREINIRWCLLLVLRISLGNIPCALYLCCQQKKGILLTTPLAALLSIGGCFLIGALTSRDARQIWAILFHSTRERTTEKKRIRIQAQSKPYKRTDYSTFVFQPKK